MIFNLIENVAYGGEFDSCIRNSLKNGKKEPHDILDYGELKQDFQAWKEQLIEDKKEKERPKVGRDFTKAAESGVNHDANAPGSIDDLEEKHTREVLKEMPGLKDADQDHQEKWVKHCKKIINTYVRFVQEHKSVKLMKHELTTSSVATEASDMFGTTMIHADVELGGESGTYPHLRAPPFREAFYTAKCRAVLELRDPSYDDTVLGNGEEGSAIKDATLQVGDFACVLDGGRLGLHTQLLKPWLVGTARDKKVMKKSACDDDVESIPEDVPEEGEEVAGDNITRVDVKMLRIVKSEASLRKRKQLLRGTLSVRQLETAVMVTHSSLVLPERKREDFEGTNRGDVLMGVHVPDISDEIQVTFKQKKVILGKARVAVGGSTQGASKSKMPPRKDSDVEPLSYHGKPRIFYKTLLSDFFVMSLIDPTP